MKKALKLHKGHIRVGKPLPWDVYDSADQLLLSRGFVIDKESQLEALLDRGMYVDAADLEAAVEKPYPVANDPFWIWDDLTAKLGYHLAHPYSDNGFARRTGELAHAVQALVQKSSDATIAIIMTTMDHRRYPIVHGLQVAALCELVAARLDWEKERRRDLVCAALTMNIGMLELQQQLTNHRGPLTPEQHHEVREHPLRGTQILRDAGVESGSWLTNVENHHETAKGTGYPRGIKELNEEALLLRTLDVYCAKISPRMHRKPMTGTQAERMIFTDAEMACDNPFIPTLIKEIGVYPPGTFVRLLNGEIAIVHKRSGSIKTPQVLSLINAKGEPLIEPIRRDTSRDGYTVSNDVPREAILISINPARFWQERSGIAEMRHWG